MSADDFREPSQTVDPVDPVVPRRGLRSLPGFTVAAVAFVVTVLLGTGGIAIANWNQSATATIDITAGAASSPGPTEIPTPVPTVVPTVTPTAPSAGPGNIVASPVLKTLPMKVDPASMSCLNAGNSGNFTIGWTGNQASGVSYVVSIKSLTASAAFAETKTVSQDTVGFSLDNKSAAYGNYLLRIQPVNTITGVAGDPSYRTLRYFGKDNSGCDYGATDNQPPLGALLVSTAPAAARPNDNVLKVSWSAGTATSYVVSIVLSTADPKYGAEFTTSTLGTELIFPPRMWNQAGTTVGDAAFFGQYSLRILPMNGSQAGDPVYRTVQYGPYDLTVW